MVVVVLLVLVEGCAAHRGHVGVHASLRHRVLPLEILVLNSSWHERHVVLIHVVRLHLFDIN